MVRLPPLHRRGAAGAPAGDVARPAGRSDHEQRLSLGSAWFDHDLVFDRGDGRPVHPDAFSRYFARLVKRIGLEGVGLHDLRHAFATNLMREVGTKDTSAALGHASEAFTMRVYQHLVPDAHAELVVAAIGRVYGGNE